MHAGGSAAGGFGHGDAGWQVEGPAYRYDTCSPDEDYLQANDLFRLLGAVEQRNLVENIAGALSQADAATQDRQIGHFMKVDPAYGKGVVEAITRIVNRV